MAYLSMIHAQNPESSAGKISEGPAGASLVSANGHTTTREPPQVSSSATSSVSLPVPLKESM